MAMKKKIANNTMVIRFITKQKYLYKLYYIIL